MFGDCPKCGKSWDAGTIPKKYRENYSPPYKFSNLIGVTDRELDSTTHYRCPHCEARFEVEEITQSLLGSEK